MAPAFSRLVPLGATAAVAVAGAKAARLSAALRAGLPVLPGWVVPCAEGRAATYAAASMVRRGEQAAARRAALSCPLDSALGAELAAAATWLGGRVIARSSSPLEWDPRWSGAFSSIAEIGPHDAATAVRSCWAAAFAVDPLARAQACGLPPEALELAVVIQPELRPDAGGTARVAAEPTGVRDGQGGDVVVDVEGVRGHPGPLLSGWADGASARLRVQAGPIVPLQSAAGSDLGGLIGSPLVNSVARLAARVHWLLGDDTIEWAIEDGKVWLLQSLASGRAEASPAGVEATGADGLGEQLSARERMPLLAAAIRARGQRLPARPAAGGTAAGRLVPCRPHERLTASSLDAILLVDRPVPALAPLLFGARGLISRSGGAGAHLAEVARSLAVPMVTGCKVPPVAAPDAPGAGANWLAAIDGTIGDVALLSG